MESLISESENDKENDFLQKMMLQMKPTEPTVAPPSSQKIVLKPGFCLKSKDAANAKIFINICTSEKIPKPKDITDEELAQVIQDPESYPPFRIPMSIGEPHAETDKGGSGCTAYDVVISDEFLDKVFTNALFQGFFLTLVFEGLENKYSLKIDRNFVVLRNKKAFGTLQDHFIRTSSKPLIMEVDADTKSSNSLVQEMTEAECSRKGETPKYTIIQVPPKGYPEFLVAEILLPKARGARSLILDIGEDRILLTSRSDIYLLDIFLPFDLIQEECGAQFNKTTQILTVTMVVKPEHPEP